MALTPESEALLNALRQLNSELRDEVKSKYQRLNPFYENLFDWKERGSYWTQKDNITIYNSTTIHGNVEIGENSWIGPFCSLDGGKVGLKIGKYCSISAACHLYTHDTVKWALSLGECEYEYAPTTIGDGCFLATGAVVTKGVTLGERCLVAANSVVTKSFDSFSIIAGVPARKIGEVKVEKSGVQLIYKT